jgi:flagellar hook-basal body complex protein FliE
MIDAISGVSATRATIAGATPLDARAVPGAGQESFAQALREVVGEAIGTVRAGEAAAMQGLTGTKPAFQVVDAVMNAQRTLQTAIAIRDKAVAAYQEISRMAI